MKFIKVKDKDGADWFINPDNVDALVEFDGCYAIHFDDDCITITTESYVDFAIAIHDDNRFVKFYNATDKGHQYINISKIIGIQDGEDERSIKLSTFTYYVIEPMDLIEKLLEEANA